MRSIAPLLSAGIALALSAGVALAGHATTDTAAAPDRLAAAHRELLATGGIRFGLLALDRLEYQTASDRDGLAWKGEFSRGRDLDRVVLASQGDTRTQESELRAAWRHAISPWFDAELGLRQDFGPQSQRSYLFAGLRGVTPYWIHTEAQLLLADRGVARLRIEAETDLRITQRLVWQPTAELNFALRDASGPDASTGLQESVLGARLRLECGQFIAPYIGVQWRHFGHNSPSTMPSSPGHSAATTLIAGFRARY